MSTRFAVLLLITVLTGCSHDIVSVPPPPPPPPPPPAAVSVAYCAGLEPDWVAFQDGDGTWTRAQPTVIGPNTTFHADIAADRGAIATVTQSGPFTIVSVLYGTPAELAAPGDTNPRHCLPTTAKTLLGTASGLGADGVAFIGSSFDARVRVGPDGAFEIKALPGGPRDLLATRFAQANGSGPLSSMILRRDVDLPDSATIPVFDFASTEAFAPAVADLTIAGLGVDGASSGTRLLTSHDEVPVTLQTNLSADVTRPYYALPEARLGAGDLQILSAGTFAGVTGSARSATVFYRAPQGRTLTLGAVLTPPTFSTDATEPAFRLRAQFVAQNEYDRAALITYQQDSTLFVTVTMTAAYAALNANGYDLITPDLSAAAGFDPAWVLHQASGLRWNAGRIGGTLGLGNNAVPTDGATRRTVSAAGTL
jgi:hypothetical protein